MKGKKAIKLIKEGFIGQRMIYVPNATIERISHEPKINDLYLTHIGHFPKAEGQYRHRPFGSQQYIFIYCKAGEGWIELENKKHIVKTNSIFIIPPLTKCTYGASHSNPWNNYWLHFTGVNAPNYSPVIGQSISIAPDINARIEDRMVLFEEMLSNLEQLNNFDNVIYANICLKYFLTSIRQIGNYRHSNQSERENFINMAISYMNSNIKTRISLEELSVACECSISNLNKVFRKHMHCPPMDYFTQLKMQRACRYLAHSDKKIKSIAHELGYDDPYYFSRLFTKTIGNSPSKYRTEERDGN